MSMIDPARCYRLKTCGFVESEEDKRFFWQSMLWARVNEEGVLVEEPRFYVYSKS